MNQNKFFTSINNPEAAMQKAFGVDLEKGNSMKIIGTTGSGKDIYEGHHPTVKNYTKQDHLDAVDKHDNAQAKFNRIKNPRMQQHHMTMSKFHMGEAKKVKNDIKKSEDSNLEKGGVGSGKKKSGGRFEGQKQIGKTGSGKSVYQFGLAHHYSDFSAKDHEDAAFLHKEQKVLSERTAKTPQEHSNTKFHKEAEKQHTKFSNEEDLEKGGVGSGRKQNHLIGHTSTEKPVYSHKKDYKDFSKEDHFQAASLHEDLKDKFEKKAKKAESGSVDKINAITSHNHHRNMMIHHSDAANNIEKNG